MRQRYFHLGLVFGGALSSAVGCAGTDDPPDMLAPSGSTTGSSSVPTSTATGGTTSTAPTTTSTGTSSTTGSSSSATSTTGASGSTGASSSTGSTSSAPAGVSFTADIHPILTMKCTGDGFCHGDGETFSKIAVSSVDDAYTAVQAVPAGGGAEGGAARVAARVTKGEMPVDGSLSAICKTSAGMHDTSKAACLTAAELALIQEWAEGGGVK